ncbi:MAG: hypothetical protein OEV78_00835 [Spirochaetia bacterium]|nr:hypothetical protein [Spirochaetia bacterium]
MNIVTSLITKINPVNGVILFLISIIILIFLKIIETVRKTKNEDIIFPTDYEIESEVIFDIKSDETSSITNLYSTIDDSSPDYGIELSSMPMNVKVTFKEQPVVIEEEYNTKKVSHNDSFSLIQEQIKQDQNIQDFILFTNPKHIFSGALKEIFTKKVAIVMNHIADYQFKVYPFYKIENSRIFRLYLEESQNIVIEELFELWRMGYSHPALPELFIHYFFAIKSDQAIIILKSMIFNNQFEEKELRRICFIYQDELEKKITFNELNENLPDKITNAFDLSNIILNKNIYLTRKKWQNWEETIFVDLNDDRKGEFYLFYNDFLSKRTSLFLYYALIYKYKHILYNQWREFIERQAFYYGHYEKLNRLDFIPPEYHSLISKSASGAYHYVKDLLSLVKNKTFYELHKFLIYYINQSKELNDYEIDHVKLNELEKSLDILYKENNYIPQAIRFILYLYYYEKNNLQKLNYISPYIHGRVGKFIPKLYQVRLIFRNKEYERAWLEISDLWNHDEDNMLLMNEAAVYAYHSGRYKESEELFFKLRTMYPDNVQILHNEAVFLQHKVRLIEENRSFFEDNYSLVKEKFKERHVQTITN